MEEKENREIKSLDDFKRFKVSVRKSFLRDRGLKVTGTKEELAALAYGAYELGVPIKLETNCRNNHFY